MDLIVKVLESVYNDANCGSLCMFLYNIKSGVPFSSGTTKRSEISPLLNVSAAMDGGYLLCEEMLIFTEIALDALDKIELCDLGITIIMFLFARYYAANQYAIMINTLHGIKEIEHMELYLKKNVAVSTATKSIAIHNNLINTTIRKALMSSSDSRSTDPNVVSPIVTSNLATDEKYGIFANADKFVGSDALKLNEFRFITSSMNSRHLTAENFIRIIQHFHLHIVESFYILTSITKNSKVITECRELSIQQMKYTFTRPIRSAVYYGDYWFVVPAGSTWFAYHQKFRTYQSYVSRDIDQVIDNALEKVTSGVLVGFVFENSIYPVTLDTPDCIGNWEKTIQEFARYGLPVIFHDTRTTAPPLDDIKYNKHIFFVKNNVTTLYKYAK